MLGTLTEGKMTMVNMFCAGVGQDLSVDIISIDR